MNECRAVNAETIKAETVKAEKSQLRCMCNRLLFVLNGMDLEIKCQKCKRMVVVHTKGIKGIKFK